MATSLQTPGLCIPLGHVSSRPPFRNSQCATITFPFIAQSKLNSHSSTLAVSCPKRDAHLYPAIAGTASSAITTTCSATSGALGSAELPAALLFDCDGVLVDTERDGHRVSFNKAFQEKGLAVEWDEDLYGELLKIGGGKERMTHHFTTVGWPAGTPEGAEERKAFIAELHKRKTQLFMEMVDTGALPLRPGVARLVNEALSNGVKVAVCSTSNEKAVSAIVQVLLGPERAASIGIYAGDIVPRKKPDPAIYTLASSTLGIEPSRCVVIEDSHIGLTAAKAAGMTCVVTKSGYTADEDFGAADAVFDCIGDAPEERFSLQDLAELALSSASVAAT